MKKAKPNFHPQINKNLLAYNIPTDVIDTYYSFLEAISHSFSTAEQNEQMPQTEVNHEALLNSIETVVFQLDAQYCFRYINQTIERFTTFTVDQLLGKHFSFLFEMVDFPTEKTASIFSTRTTGHIEKVVPVKSTQGLKWFRVEAEPILENDICTGAIGSMVDVTYLKNTELELVKASRAKSDFLSTMSHEIRTPLNAVIGMSNLLKMQEYLPEQEESLNAMKFASEHLLGLINDILDYNKIEAGKITFSKVSFNLHEMLAGLQRTFGISAREKQLDFEVTQDFKLDHYVITDRTRLFQILTNLIGNALKFTEKGSVRLHITKVQETNSKVDLRFEVIDTGIGIPAEKLDSIFEQFSQIDTALNRTFNGTGLGLAISSRLLRMQGSELYVRSKVGVGSSFYFTFSFTKGAVYENVEAGQSNIEDPFQHLEKPIEILMAEDNIMNVVLIKRFFKLWNIKLDVVHNGMEAIEKIKTRDYDMVLMDIQMPVLDGFTATRKIRALESPRFKEVPIIALTASVDTQYRSQACDLGMDDYLTKPFNPEEFRQKIIHYYHLRNERKKANN